MENEEREQRNSWEFNSKKNQKCKSKKKQQAKRCKILEKYRKR